MINEAPLGETDTIIVDEVSPQALHDGGLNPFAVTLLLESFQSGPWLARIRKLSFIHRSNHNDSLPFRITIEAVEPHANT